MAEVEAFTLEPTETMAEAEVLSQDFEEKVLVTMEDAVKGADKDDEDEEDEPLQMNRVVDSTIDQHEEENPPTANENDWGSSLFVSEDNISVASEDVYEALNEEAVTRDGIAIIVPQVENAWEYHRYEEEEEEPRVEQILEEYNDGGILEYLVQYTDGLEEVVSFRWLPCSRIFRFIAVLVNTQHTSPHHLVSHIIHQFPQFSTFNLTTNHRYTRWRLIISLLGYF